MIVPVCPICLSKVSEWKCGFKQCNFCGLVYFSEKGKLSPASVYNKLNEKDIYFYSQVNMFCNWLEKLEKIPNITRKILDIGCVYGDFIKIAISRGWTAEGIEISPEMVSQCRSSGLKVYDKPVEELNLPYLFYDVVTIWNTLDNMPDPFIVLNKIYLILKPGGVLLIRDYNFLFHRLSFKMQNTTFCSLLGLKPSILHNWNFTPKSIEILLKKTGFENIKIINSKPTKGDPYTTGGRLGRGFMILFKHLYYLFSQAIYFLSFGDFVISPSFIAITRK